MSKVYSLEEAFDIMEEIDNGDYSHQSNRQTNFFEIRDERTEMLDADNLGEIVNDFQEFILDVLDDLESIMKNHPEEMENVELDWRIIAEESNVLQVEFIGYYKEFSFQHQLVAPTIQWQNNREQVMRWVRAIVLREYRRYNDGNL